MLTNTRSGFYGATAIANYMHNSLGLKAYTDNLNPDKFTYTDYPDSWLGETGRQFSRTWVGVLDDFTLIYPDYQTGIEIECPGRFDLMGDFSLLVNRSVYDTDYDVYTTSLHYSYMPSAGLNTIITNTKVKDGVKVLLISDSFDAVVAPFLSLACGKVNMWDMRNHDESVYDYISNGDFDVVMVAYTDYFKDIMYDFD